MFIIKYHAKNHPTQYFGDKKRVVNKQFALAFGENLREKYKVLESPTCTLVTIPVSQTAEMMYANTFIKVGKIAW